MIIAFDFDGTLIDSYHCLEESFYETLKKYRLIPFKRLFAKILTTIETYLEGPKLGRHRKPREIYFTNSKFWLEWLKIRGRLSKPVDGALDVIKELKRRGHHIISFSAEDFVPGMKIYRIKNSPFYQFFDEIIIFGRDLSVQEALEKLIEKYKQPVIWVDDKPWRFLKTASVQNAYFVWFKFPPTSRFVNKRIYDRLKKLDNFYEIDNLKSLIELVENIKV